MARDVVREVLATRGVVDNELINDFLHPNYDAKYDPFWLPDMDLAVKRIVEARQRQEHVTVFGDYDIDGLTATTVLVNALRHFGFNEVDYFLPNRFSGGYGMTIESVESIAQLGTKLIITVDCGSLNHREISRARELGMEVIVTDHHNVLDTKPDAVALVNPKWQLHWHSKAYDNYRLRHSIPNITLYPFVDLCGVGVAFKLVQALQTKLDGIDEGMEKWFLDLVALGTVCDSVTLLDENRANVYWGLRVMRKTPRLGLRALMKVSGVTPDTLNSRALGFALGPRMNAAGRLETAQYAMDMLQATTRSEAIRTAAKLDVMNKARRVEQDAIFRQACEQAETDGMKDDRVLVVSGEGWNHGIVGIVASKLVEKYHKPTFVIQEDADESVGSARSFGDFSVADAIRYAEPSIIKGGGHKMAAGVSLQRDNIAKFRHLVNEFYDKQKFEDQSHFLRVQADVNLGLGQVTEDLVHELAMLEPFGMGNVEPIVETQDVEVQSIRRMGQNGQHVKLLVSDANDDRLSLLAFNAPERFFALLGSRATIWYHPEINVWHGHKSVEARLLDLR